MQRLDRTHHGELHSANQLKELSSQKQLKEEEPMMFKNVSALIITILAVGVWLTPSIAVGQVIMPPRLDAVVLECVNGFIDPGGTQSMSTIALPTDQRLSEACSQGQTCDKCMVFLRNMGFDLVQISAMSVRADGVVNMLFTKPMPPPS